MADLQRLFDLADPRIRGIWDEKSSQLSSRLEYQKLGFTDYDAEISDPKFEPISGLGLAQQTGEKEAYSQDDVVQAVSATISPVKHTLAIDITEEMLRFNLWPKVNSLVGGVANGLRGRIDKNASKIFYLGSGTTFFTGHDGSALFAAHTLADGSTNTNNTTNILNYDNLKTAAQALDRFVDDKGIQLLPCNKLRLIVAREKKEKAEEVLRSIGNPDSANRVNNVFNNGEGYMDYVVANWIPSTTYGNYWFVIDQGRAEEMLKMVWGWKPKFDSDNVVNNGTKIYTGSSMFQPGFQSWQFGYGSTASS